MTAEPAQTPDKGGVLWPAVTIMLVSAASMALEIIAGRALAPYVGMSLYTWTVVIAVVLAGLSLGHWIGGLMADRTAHPRRMAAIGLTAAAATTLICLALLKAAAPALHGAAPVAQMAALAIAAFFLPSTFAGFLSPLLTVIALRRSPPERQGGVLGVMFAVGAMGAILGTLFAGLVMISWLGTAYSVAAVGGLYAALSLPYWRGRAAMTVAATSVALLVGAGAWPERSGLSTPCLEESRYFCIQVDDISGYEQPARVMALDHLAHGVNDAADPRLLLSPYVQGIDELTGLRFPGPSISAFFIGGGAYTLPRAWAARYPAGRFTIAELDPQVTEVARRLMWFAPDERTMIRHGDARQVLRSEPAAARFDVIFGDAFHDISIPHHLVTDAFNAEVAERLNPGGIYALNVVDALRAPRFLLSLANTLKARFAHVELWIDRDSIQPQEKRTTWIVLASDTATPADFVTARYGAEREWARVPLDRMIDTLGEDRLVFLTDDYAPVDRLLANVLLNPELSEAAASGR